MCNGLFVIGCGRRSLLCRTADPCRVQLASPEMGCRLRSFFRMPCLPSSLSVTPVFIFGILHDLVGEPPWQELLKPAMPLRFNIVEEDVLEVEEWIKPVNFGAFYQSVEERHGPGASGCLAEKPVFSTDDYFATRAQSIHN